MRNRIGSLESRVTDLEKLNYVLLKQLNKAERVIGKILSGELEIGVNSREEEREESEVENTKRSRSNRLRSSLKRQGTVQYYYHMSKSLPAGSNSTSHTESILLEEDEEEEEAEVSEKSEEADDDDDKEKSSKLKNLRSMGSHQHVCVWKALQNASNSSSSQSSQQLLCVFVIILFFLLTL